jgi:hypothetical protein
MTSKSETLHRRAIMLLTAAYVISTGNNFLATMSPEYKKLFEDYYQQTNHTQPSGEPNYLGIALGGVLATVLLWAIAKGKNWGRITSAIMFCIGCTAGIYSYYSVPGMWSYVKARPLSEVMGFITMGLQAAALYLLFATEAKEQFQKRTVNLEVQPPQ